MKKSLRDQITEGLQDPETIEDLLKEKNSYWKLPLCAVEAAK